MLELPQQLHTEKNSRKHFDRFCRWTIILFCLILPPYEILLVFFEVFPRKPVKCPQHSTPAALFSNQISPERTFDTLLMASAWLQYVWWTFKPRSILLIGKWGLEIIFPGPRKSATKIQFLMVKKECNIDGFLAKELIEMDQESFFSFTERKTHYVSEKSISLCLNDWQYCSHNLNYYLICTVNWTHM